MLPGLATAMMGGSLGGGTSGSFEASVSPTSISRTATTSGPAKTLTTAAVLVTASGGSGSYSYAWSRISGSAAITATVSSSSLTQFTATLNADDEKIATFTCIVTDTVSGSTVPVSVDVDIYLIGPGA